ncbi:sigma 54-interacting transcriptional regulator [bacterium]|nr:sigma 54-interacting transcriptional regulator [bacterium]
MITLTVESSTRPIVFPLMDSATEMIAGSLPENAIYLPFKGISRKHFAIVKKKNDWWIRDLGSTNGILINGKKVAEAPLKRGDLIQAGTALIRIESTDEEIQTIEPVGNSVTQNEALETDKVGMVPLQPSVPMYSFSKLKFPEDFVPCHSPAMMEVLQKINSIRDSDASVLLFGETGTGKEMMARTLHLSSKRSAGPFVAINCAAIPEDLAETELFGIGEKVATNVSQRKGKIGAADKGTLFLDELSAFPYDLQAKVLRALQEKSVTPIGENRPISVDFRLVSATNQEPEELIQGQKLREDLYHRLATIEIDLPPLRKRKEDLEILIPALLYQISKTEDKHLAGISKRLMALLINYDYPGNIRELTNILRSMVALAHPGEILDIHLIPEKLLDARTFGAAAFLQEKKNKPYDLRETVQNVTKELIVQALAQNNGNIKKTADYLKVTTFGLRKTMKRLGIRK